MLTDVFHARHSSQSVGMTFINVPCAVSTPVEPSITNLVTFPRTAAAALHVPRAGSEATTASPTTSSSSGPTTTKPFFPDPSRVTPPPGSVNSEGDNGLAKSVLEYAILAVGIVIIGSVILQRCIRLRRHNEPLSRFFSLSSSPRLFPSSSASHPFVHPLRFPRTTGLSEVPPYPYAHHTRAYDTDAAGRRLGGLQVSDHDGYIGDKDVLPAYDNAGGPPKYGEHEMWSTPPRNSSLATGIGAAPDRPGGTGAASQTPVGGAELAVRDRPGTESRSQAHTLSAARSPESDVERGEGIPAPAPVHKAQLVFWSNNGSLFELARKKTIHIWALFISKPIKWHLESSDNLDDLKLCMDQIGPKGATLSIFSTAGNTSTKRIWDANMEGAEMTLAIMFGLVSATEYRNGNLMYTCPRNRDGRSGVGNESKRLSFRFGEALLSPLQWFYLMVQTSATMAYTIRLAQPFARVKYISWNGHKPMCVWVYSPA
ncbi:hypothetical protein LshimejAT787_1602380 [Lyophyllum shimeji]|uniref:Uncharacterized protein n=1 Tax=Lyophyllum shimeji TaxID=47721 RepID=A0A9P3PYD7_LYOSH|nr:hypothetical protein LshimejAT787_1602380 [Lyophyllum shimeji]